MNKSKLPKKTRAILSNEIKRLYRGYEKVVNIPFQLSLKTAIQVAWIGDVSAQFKLQDGIEQKLADQLIAKIVPRLEKAGLQEAKVLTKRIDALNKKLDTICKEYETDPHLEFELLVEDYKLYLHNRW